jgi:hypothetical protein
MWGRKNSEKKADDNESLFASPFKRHYLVYLPLDECTQRLQNAQNSQEQSISVSVGRDSPTAGKLYIALTQKPLFQATIHLKSFEYFTEVTITIGKKTASW